LQKFEALGAIHEVDWQVRDLVVRQQYKEAATHGDVLVVSKTHEEIAGISHAIRQDRRAAGELGVEETVLRHNR
jgi:hypothetical protein